MNKPIDYLMYQAGLTAQGCWDAMDDYDHKAILKFAELILIEVTDILSTYRCKVVFQDGAEYNYEHPIIAIRKHFGVQE
jgi:hypothetical protein